MKPIRIAIIGYRQDRRGPACARDPGQYDRFELVATSSRSGQGVGQNVHRLARADPHRRWARSGRHHDAARPRVHIARECIEAGLQCLLEKPPTTGLAEIATSTASPRARASPCSPPGTRSITRPSTAAAKALAGKRIKSMTIHWHEDVHKWHPGQQLDLGAGRLRRVRPRHQRLLDRDQNLPGRPVRPEGRAQLPRERPDSDRRRRHLLQPGSRWPAEREPRLAPDRGRGMDDHRRDRATAPASGSRTAARGSSSTARPSADNGIGEYPDIYRTFVDLIDERRSLVDVAPLRLVADCLLVGGRKVVEPVNG